MRKGALNIAVKAARTAGAVIVRHMNRLESLTIVEKGRNDFASEVDRLAEAEVVREIKRAFPDHAILAEEGGATPGKGRPRFQWVIDPLDGTHNYLRGFPHFSVSIEIGRAHV